MLTILAASAVLTEAFKTLYISSFRNSTANLPHEIIPIYKDIISHGVKRGFKKRMGD
jgi:hypothetical protein